MGKGDEHFSKAKIMILCQGQMKQISSWYTDPQEIRKKRNQIEMMELKRTITKIKNSLAGFHSTFEQA